MPVISNNSLNVLNNWILQRIEDGWLPDRHDYWFTTTVQPLYNH